jgi:hypothetical protein
MPQDAEGRGLLDFDVNVPSSARVWNYWVGGKDNFPADRAAGEQIPEARRTLDFSKPVAVILIFVRHFVRDAERPYDVVRRLMDPLPSGSYLVMAHAASDGSWTTRAG